MLPQEPSAFPDKQPDPKVPPAVEVDELLRAIEHSDDFSYIMMNLEVWALVETLDRVFPGAWGQFMTNRQSALKRFLEKEEGSAARDFVANVTDRRKKEQGTSNKDEEKTRKKEQGTSNKEQG